MENNFHGESESVAVDASGNVYVAGYFGGSVDFDPGPSVFELTAMDFSIFVSKFDSSGNFVWAKAFVGDDGGFGFATGLAVDGSGSVFTAGHFEGTVDFDPGPGTFNLSAATADVFVSKIDSSGDYVWAKAFSGDNYGAVNGVAIDGVGSVLLSGRFSGTVDFDPGPGEFNLTETSGTGLRNDAFVSKLDGPGNLVWAKAFGGDVNSEATGVAVDGVGNTYISGELSGTIDADPGPGTFNLTADWGTDAFVSKLDASGNLLWAKAFHGSTSSEVRGTAMAVDGSRGVYVTGEFFGTADFDPGPATFNLTATEGELFDDPDAFLVRLDESGDLDWVATVGGDGMESGSALAVDGSGNVFYAGDAGGQSIDFDPGPGRFTLGPMDYGGRFLSKLVPAGGAVCRGEAVTINMNAIGRTGTGTASEDVILGTPFDDVITGLGGPDTICAGPGDDVVEGGDGADLIFGAGGADTIDGGPGADIILGGGGPDIIVGGAGPDDIDGHGSADTIEGGSGADVVDGQNGADILRGGAGSDTLRGQTGPDTIHGDTQDDSLTGGNGNDVLYGGAGFDKCSGNTGPSDQAEAATCEQTPGIEVLF